MATTVTLNGVNYVIPAVGDQNWGDNVSNYLIANASGTLQKSGGVFSLTADVDFGATFGLKSNYLTSRSLTPSATGFIRLANVDALSFRNIGNTADIQLKPSADGIISYGGIDLVNLSATQALTNKTISGASNTISGVTYGSLVLSNSIVNNDVNAAAAIAYSKLNLAASIVNSDVSATAAVAYSKLNLAASVVNTDISATAAIAYAKLNLSASVVNSDIATTAAIAYSKLNLTNSIQTTDLINNSITTAKLAQAPANTIKGNNTGVTANVVDLTVPQVLSLIGPIPIANGGTGQTTQQTAINSLTGAQAAGKYLRSDGTNSTLSSIIAADVPTLNQNTTGTAANITGIAAVANGGTGQSSASAAFNALSPINTLGDLIVGSAPNTAARLPVGTNGFSLVADSTQALGLKWALGAGGGSGINYITNSGAESDTSGWALYQDAAGVTPVNGLGAPGAGASFSRTTTAPLRGAASFQLIQTNATNIQGYGIRYPFTIDSADQAKMLSISFDYNASNTFQASSGAVGSDSDIEAYIYDVTNSTLIPVSPKVLTAQGANNYSFKGVFQTASNSTSYRLLIHAATTSAAAAGYTFKFDNVSVGPQTFSQGAPVTDLVQFTPTITGFGTPTSVSFYSRRVGDSLEVVGSFVSGTPTNVVAGISFGSGGANGNVVSDTTKVATSQSLGTGVISLNNASYFGLYPIAASGSQNYINIGVQSSTNGASVAAIGTSIALPGSTLSFNYKIPIVGWASTVQLSQDTDTRVVAAKYISGSAAISSTYSDVSFAPSKDTHASFDGVSYTIPVSGYYFMTTECQITATTITAGNVTGIGFLKNGVFQKTTSNNNPVSASTPATLIVTYFDQFVAGDKVKVQVRSTDTGPSFQVQPIWELMRLSGPAAIAATESVNAGWYLTTPQSVANGALTVLKFDTKDYDTHNAYNSATGIYTVPVAGKYRASFQYGWASTAVFTAYAYIYKNGALVVQNFQTTDSSNNKLLGVIPKTLNCQAGDTIDFRVQQNTGAINTLTAAQNVYMNIERVGN